MVLGLWNKLGLIRPLDIRLFDQRLAGWLTDSISRDWACVFSCIIQVAVDETPVSPMPLVLSHT